MSEGIAEALRIVLQIVGFALLVAGWRHWYYQYRLEAIFLTGIGTALIVCTFER